MQKYQKIPLYQENLNQIILIAGTGTVPSDASTKKSQIRPGAGIMQDASLNSETLGSLRIKEYLESDRLLLPPRDHSHASSTRIQHRFQP